MNRLLEKVRVISFGCLFWGLAWGFPAKAFNFNEVITFGDSLSDSGNVFTFFESQGQQSFITPPFGALVPPLPYASARFTDGLNYVDFLAADFNFGSVPFLLGGPNYAVGGAQTGPLGTTLPTPPSLLDQTAQYLLNTGGVASSDALYIIHGSNNDLRPAAVLKQQGNDAIATNIAQNAVGNLSTIIGTLATAGATEFLVFNSSDLGLTPEATRGPAGLVDASTMLSSEFNTLLSGALDSLDAAFNIDLIRFDLFDLSQQVVANPTSFGLTDTINPCITETTVCSNPDDFLFYDGIHPTSAGHRILASAVSDTLRPIPEPSVILSLGLMLGLRIASRQRTK